MKFRLATSLLLFGRLVAAQNPPTGSFSGVVHDELGRPIRDALIVLDAETTPMRTRSIADGSFRIDRVPIGGHELQVVRIGFRPHRSRISMIEAGVSVEIALSTAPTLLDTVSVRVSRTGIHGIVVTRGISLLPHEPRPLRGAIVEVLDSPFRTTTTADGRFTLGDVKEGAYSLLVRIDRYQSRIVPAYVPAEGGVDLNIVLDSTIADWQRREDMELREISRRLREANNPSAFVSAAELAFPEGTTLRDALRETPSTLNIGLLLKDDITCIYVDGDPRPGATAADFVVEDIHAVEVYGLDGRGRTQAPIKPWLMGTFCGTGSRMGPGARPQYMPGERPPRLEADNIARVAVIWLKRRR